MKLQASYHIRWGTLRLVRAAVKHFAAAPKGMNSSKHSENKK